MTARSALPRCSTVRRRDRGLLVLPQRRYQTPLRPAQDDDPLPFLFRRFRIILRTPSGSNTRSATSNATSLDRRSPIAAAPYPACLAACRAGIACGMASIRSAVAGAFLCQLGRRIGSGAARREYGGQRAATRGPGRAGGALAQHGQPTSSQSEYSGGQRHRRRRRVRTGYASLPA